MLPFKSLISSCQITPEVLTILFEQTDIMAQHINDHGRVNLLKDKIIALLFFEPSSRTMLSFQSAAQRLKAGTIFAQNEGSTSFKKGESLEDMIKITAGYSDIIVMRHAQAGSAEIAAKHSSVPFINAGDGGNEHPTQSIIDAYTIHKHVGRLNNLKVMFGFDALQSRSIHSLSKLLSQFNNNEFIFFGPESLFPDTQLMNELTNNGVKIRMQDHTKITSNCDVVYVNRLQQERFENQQLFEDNRRHFRLNAKILQETQAIILDPLPRIDEISPCVDKLDNALYFKQASYGVAVRMALLNTLLA